MEYNNFNIEQLQILSSGINKGLDIRWYLDHNFSVEQMKLIEECLIDGIDVKYIANYKFSVEQMRLIIEGQKEGLDVSLYANENFNIYRMKTIKACLRNGIHPNTIGYTTDEIEFYGSKLNDSEICKSMDKRKEEYIEQLKCYTESLSKNTSNVLQKKK